MFRQINITALSDIPGYVQTFAEDVGFTVGGSSSAPTVQRPDDGSAITFEFSLTTASDAAGTFDVLQWKGTGSDNTKIAWTLSPRHMVGGTFTRLAPSKLIMFGALTPQPYLAIVVAYGFNLYRHLYLGHMEILGDYTGGEIIAGSGFRDRSISALSYRDPLAPTHAYLFSSYQPLIDSAHCGGVHINHADNTTYPFRVFSRPNTVSISTPIIPESAALGGFVDNINDGYLARAKSRFNSANILVPINLYAARPGPVLSPIGRVPGIRMVRMDDIDPEETISIGSAHWECIPAFEKNSSQTVPGNATFPYGITDETSWMVGYAYRTDL